MQNPSLESNLFLQLQPILLPFEQTPQKSGPYSPAPTPLPLLPEPRNGHYHSTYTAVKVITTTARSYTQWATLARRPETPGLGLETPPSPGFQDTTSWPAFLSDPCSLPVPAATSSDARVLGWWRCHALSLELSSYPNLQGDLILFYGVTYPRTPTFVSRGRTPALTSRSNSQLLTCLWAV